MVAQSKEERKQAIKQIIRELHQGLTPQDAKTRFEKEVGKISSAEIAEIEQSLIEEGMAPEEITRFCNVHALLFESALEGAASAVDNPSHPIHLFQKENEELKRRLDEFNQWTKKAVERPLEATLSSLRTDMEALGEFQTHYMRKEQVLFPYLDRYGFTGPSKVMWEKDNEIRDFYRKCIEALRSIEDIEDLEKWVAEALAPLLEELDGMIFKEENILFPTALEKLQAADWAQLLRDSEQVGYAWIEPPEEVEHLLTHLGGAVSERPVWRDEQVVFPSGALDLTTLMHMLNTLPVEITFADQEGVVRYFSETSERIFVRSRGIIGRKVENCHPPESIDRVAEIVEAFESGRRDSAAFWLEIKGRFIYIVFYAVRDEDGRYLGTMEVAQDLTDLRQLEGERRLLDE